MIHVPLAILLLALPAPATTAMPASNATPAAKMTPATAATSAPTPEPAARMVLSETTFDAGTVVRGTPLKHDFTVRNDGKVPLALLVKPSCGCTVADYPKTLEVGKSGTVSLSVDTTRFEGRITKVATLSSNDPAQASIQLSIGGEVKVPAEAPAPGLPKS